MRCTLALLWQCLWWSSMERDTVDFVAACQVCAQHKSTHKASSGLLHPPFIPDVFGFSWIGTTNHHEQECKACVSLVQAFVWQCSHTWTDAHTPHSCDLMIVTNSPPTVSTSQSNASGRLRRAEFKELAPLFMGPLLIFLCLERPSHPPCFEDQTSE